MPVSEASHVFPFQDSMCILYIASEDKRVNVASEHLRPVQPKEGDKVSKPMGGWGLIWECQAIT